MGELNESMNRYVITRYEFRKMQMRGERCGLCGCSASSHFIDPPHECKSLRCHLCTSLGFRAKAPV